ncbi:ABC transporter substrate-binding protein [Saccharibacillus kuerlensis]|uniref:ABC transporter extracellular-binding protein YurO n=1 Tax=Saccharibacillus kuerlensis TaxID=459527 RepID=A0ABQ2KUY9_9BACL|nr:ABC transporter substrate-binding protein [Saccharibacillus kuerlensis]GGN93368.1 putative ABC transporter extracellular-binding protein YurO [Saccharibacillus kuerlensis]
MLKRKLMLLPALLLTAAAALSGCSQGGSTGGAGEKVINIYQGKVEISNQLAEMKQVYEESHPGVTLNIQSVGGGTDYAASLKSRFSAGAQPDIFTIGGFQERDLWLEYLEDLSDQPWVQNMDQVAKDPMSANGKLYGFPLNYEGYGFLYNKDIFKEAGITEIPKTLSELEQAAQKIEEAGYTPFVNAYAEWWVLGNHNVNVPFARQDDPEAFLKSLDDSNADIRSNEIFAGWLDLLDLTLKYGNANPLTTDYNTQMSTFANGQAAMTQQGNWVQPTLDGINPDLNVGMMPMPISEDPEANDKLFVGVPTYWVINKNSPVKKEAKELLEWMATSPEGQEFLTTKFQFIPAFNNIQGDPEGIGKLGADLTQYIEEGKVLNWYFQQLPIGTPQDYANLMQSYIAGRDTRDEMLKNLQTSYDNLKVR